MPALLSILFAYLAIGPSPIQPPQQREEERARCSDESAARDDNAVVAACTALLRRADREDDALAISHRARAYVRLGDYARAVPDYRKAVQLQAGDYRMWNGLCWSLAVRGEDLVEGRAACDRGLQLHPDDPEILDSRGLLSLKQGRFQDAWNDYDRACSIEPRGLSWLYGRGISALRLGRVEEGAADLRRAETEYPRIRPMFESYGIVP
jgi:Flp pilus assembly protein TadD